MKLKNTPKKIYLQVEGEGIENDFKKLRGITWSIDRINKSDIVYYLKAKK